MLLNILLNQASLLLECLLLGLVSLTGSILRAILDLLKLVDHVIHESHSLFDPIQ